jgi:cytoskeletal protein CcmA (bactofilin family)
VTVFKNQPGNLEQKSNQQKCQSLNSNKLPPDNSFSFSYQNNSFFFFCNYKQNDQLIKLEKGEKLLFTLENISAEPAGGSRGTRVELKYQNGNLTYGYGTDKNFIIGNQLQYLNIVNQRGSKNLPMYVGFIGATAEDKASVVGSNRVLNDGETANTLILTFRYLNRLQDSPKRSPGKNNYQNSQLEEGLSLLGKVGNTDTATKFRITFDVLADKSPDSGYRLLGETNANAVKMKIYSGSTYLGVDVGSEQWEIRTDGQGNTRQWIITCKKDALNLTDEILRLEISDLKTELQAGYANLYVYYENIPGYWDGHIICPIEKGPLMLAKDEKGEESVGIGTNKPLAKLHIIQKKTTGSPVLLVDQKGDRTKPAAVFLNGNVGIGTNYPQQTLDVEGKIHVRKGVIQKGGDPITATNDLGLYSLNQGDWMRLVTNNGPIRFFTDDKIGSTIRLSVEKDGNVGIGTTDGESALAKLDVRGSAIISEKLDVKGAVDIAGKLNAKGAVDVTGKLDAKGAVDVTGKLDAKGAVDVTGKLNAKGAVDIAGKLDAKGGLNVAGDSNSNVLSVEQTKGSKNTGYFKGGGGICIDGVTEGNGLYISSNSSSNHSLSVRQLDNSGKAAHFEGNVEVTGSISCGGKIGIYSNWTYQGSTYTGYLSGKNKRKRGEGDADALFVDNCNDAEKFTLTMDCSRELKENIVSISTEEATSTLEHLNPVKYDYKNDRAFRPNIGFIAEEMPDNLASYDKKSLSPFEVTPILTKVVQEQQKTIALLQQRLDEFERSR